MSWRIINEAEPEAGGAFTQPLPPEDRQVMSEIITLLSHGAKIKAIKLYRQQFGVGLKEAKEAIDVIGEQNGIPSSSGYGCFSLVLLGITVIVRLLS